MLANELMIDEFERIKGIVHRIVEGLSVSELSERPNDSANSIAWLVWHITRGQDDHISDLADKEQIWVQEWFDKFNLPFSKDITGYGQSSDDVAKVKATAELLLGYYDATHEATIEYIKGLKESDYSKIVDKSFNPPVSLAVRLVSIVAEGLQHAGQASYVRGLTNQ